VYISTGERRKARKKNARKLRINLQFQTRNERRTLCDIRSKYMFQSTNKYFYIDKEYNSYMSKVSDFLRDILSSICVNILNKPTFSKFSFTDLFGSHQQKHICRLFKGAVGSTLTISHLVID
jgi:hypothetical protein